MNEVQIQKFRCTVRRRDDPDKVEILIREAATLEQALHAVQAKGYLAIAIEPFLEAEAPRGPQGGEPPLLEIPPVKVQPKVPPKKAGGIKVPDVAGSGTKKKRFSFFGRVNTRELIAFAVQLAALLKSGIPLLNSLKIIRRGTSKRYFQGILEDLMTDVSAGFPLHYGLRRHPRAFPPLWGNLVEVGEVSGTLVDVLEEIARYQEASQRLKGKVISAFFYPAVVMVMVLGALTFLLLFIIPKFKEILTGLHIELPFLTLLVIGASDLLRNYFPWLALFLIAVFFLLRLAARTKKGRLVISFLFLKIPILGNLNLQVSIVRFARSFATLLKAGTPILGALKIAAKLAENFYVGELIKETYEGVEAGHGLGNQLEKSGLFPVFMTQLISVGEESGELVRFLSLISNYYEERVDAFLARFSTVLEPIMLVIVGIVVGTIVISIFLPLTSISTMGG